MFNIRCQRKRTGVDVKIKTNPEADIREAVFYKMSELKCPILKMQYSSLSLEDVFLELTQDEMEEEIPREELVRRKMIAFRKNGKRRKEKRTMKAIF